MSLFEHERFRAEFFNTPSPLQVGKSRLLDTARAIKERGPVDWWTGGPVDVDYAAGERRIAHHMLHGAIKQADLWLAHTDDKPDWEVDPLASYGEKLYRIFVDGEVQTVAGLTPLSSEAERWTRSIGPVAGDMVKYNGCYYYLDETRQHGARVHLFLNGLDEDEDEDVECFFPEPEPPHPQASLLGRLINSDWDQDSLVAAIQEADDDI